MKNRSLTIIMLLAPFAIHAQDSELPFKSSDTTAVRIFDWAKQRALASTHRDDPVGEWYEATIRGREAFCLRDRIHQSMGVDG